MLNCRICKMVVDERKVLRQRRKTDDRPVETTEYFCPTCNKVYLKYELDRRREVNADTNQF